MITRPKQTRAAVVGATGILGKELLEELNASAAAAWDLRALDETEGEESQLSAVGEEATLIQPLTPEALDGMDVIFFAGAGAVATEYLRAARQSGAAVVDLTGALLGQEHFLLRLAVSGSGAKPDLTTVGVVIPHPAVTMLAAMAERLERAFGLERLVATVLEPASQAGKAALDELHQQTVSLLSFQSVPQDVYDAQVAFNLQTGFGEAAKVSLQEQAATIRRQMQILLGDGLAQRVSLQLAQAPVFHGYTVSAHAGLRAPTGETAVREALHGGFVRAEADTVASNVAVVESGELLVQVQGETTGAEAPGVWLWMAADNLRLHAHTAVAAALEMVSLRPLTTMQ